MALLSLGNAFGQDKPIVTLCDIEKEVITRNELTECGELVTSDTLWCLVRFDLNQKIGSDMLSQVVNGNKLPEGLLSGLHDIPPSKTFYFENLIVVNAKGDSALPDPLQFKLIH